MTVKLTFENFYQVAEEGADAGVVGNAAGEEGGGKGVQLPPPMPRFP